MLLPKLQGTAGDFVFDELNPKERANYKTLIKCLKHRFRKVESTKTYVVMFWKRNQKASETEETYAVDLKCIYGKAYPQWDNSARKEDLLCRFLNGLLDQKARKQIEFVKDPSNIDDALDEVVKYCESGVTDDSVKEGTAQRPARAAHTNAAETENSDDDEADDEETDNRVARATKPFNKDKKSNVPQYKPKDSTVVKNETPVATVNQIKSLIVESEKTMKELLIQQANVGNKGGAQGGNKNQGGKDGNKGGPMGQVSVLQVVHAITVRSMGISGMIVKILMCHTALDSSFKCHKH